MLTRHQLSLPGIPGSDPDAEIDAAKQALVSLLAQRGGMLYAQVARLTTAKAPAIRASSLTHRGWGEPSPLAVALTAAKLADHEVVTIAERFATVERAPPGTNRNQGRHNGKRVLDVFQGHTFSTTLQLRLGGVGRDPVTRTPVMSVLGAVLARMRVATLREALEQIACVNEDDELSLDYVLPDGIGLDEDTKTLVATAPMYLHLLDDVALLAALGPLVVEAQARSAALKVKCEALFKPLRIKPAWFADYVEVSRVSVPKLRALGIPVEHYRAGRVKIVDLQAHFDKAVTV